MAIQLADTLAPMADYPLAMSEDIQFTDGSTLESHFESIANAKDKLILPLDVSASVTSISDLGNANITTIPNWANLGGNPSELIAKKILPILKVITADTVNTEVLLMPSVIRDNLWVFSNTFPIQTTTDSTYQSDVFTITCIFKSNTNIVQTAPKFQVSVVTVDIDGKQDKLSTAQLEAVDSGITQAKVDTYDGLVNGQTNLEGRIDTLEATTQSLETNKQDTLTQDQLNAVNSTITLDKVTSYDKSVQEIGTLASLSTNEKTNLVGAINEVLTDIGTLSDLTTTNKNSIVEAINEINANGGSSGSAGTSSDVTYVVDSDQALQDWADNVKENDYTNVLIKKGTWTVTKRLNLSNKTKTVVGEFGSKLVFDGCMGILYNADESSTDRWMRNVHVECINGTEKQIGFQYCLNLTDCSVKIITTWNVVGFSYCNNLVGCQVFCESTAVQNFTAHGFSYCNYLTRCESVAEGLTQAVGTGYTHCNYLTNCKGKGTGLVNAFAFNSCNHLVNCEGEATGRQSDSRTAATSATRYCNYLVNHKSVSTVDAGSAFGYRFCEGLTNCIGTGTGTTGVVFKECKGLSRCRKHETSTTGVFSQSYASFSENATYACADTPEGGFNDPTN